MQEACSDSSGEEDAGRDDSHPTDDLLSPGIGVIPYALWLRRSFELPLDAQWQYGEYNGTDATGARWEWRAMGKRTSNDLTTFWNDSMIFPDNPICMASHFRCQGGADFASGAEFSIGPLFEFECLNTTYTRLKHRNAAYLCRSPDSLCQHGSRVVFAFVCLA